MRQTVLPTANAMQRQVAKLMETIDDLNDILKMAEAWKIQVPENRYADELRDDVIEYIARIKNCQRDAEEKTQWSPQWHRLD